VGPRWQQILDDTRGVWRFRWTAVVTAAGLAIAGWLVVFTLPDRYGARAVVLVDPRTAFAPALQGLAVEEDVAVQLNYVRESLLADPQLRRTAQEAGVFPPYAIDAVRQEELLSQMKKHIELTVQSADERNLGVGGTTYVISYQDVDRMRSLRVVSILLDAFVNETLGGKRESSNSAQQFLQSQVRDYEKRLRAAEDRLADFKSRHLGLMPSEQGGYFAELQRETEAVESTRTKLLTAESRRNTLQGQLHGDAAISASASPNSQSKGLGGAGTDTVSRIAEAQAHLDDLLLHYTDQHPDVIATRQVLVELKQRRSAEIESLRSGDANAAATSGASANPVFQSIQVALNQANVDISDLQTELGRHESKVKQLRQLLGTAPQVEAEYAQLARDYDVNKTQYTALLSNLEKARVGGRADEAGSLRFEVAQPPIASLRPVSPRRGLFLTMVLLGALAGGAVLAYRLDRLHPVVNSAGDIQRLAGVAVVGVVGLAFPTRSTRKARREVWGVSVAAACLVAAFVALWYASNMGVRLSIPALRHLVQV
jgi:polysaccharide chain length determinant protein (PEP-CTERM system associated)